MDFGFLFNYSMQQNPAEKLSPGLLNRVMLIDRALKQSGNKLFCFSPSNIRSTKQPVPGYRLDGNQFVATEAQVPTVNGNWTHRTRKLMEQGMGYQELLDWSYENGIGIYVPLEFSELVANKLETYRVISRFDANLHPYTEPYRQSRAQLDHFMTQNELIFLKPRGGNKGDEIISLRKDSDGFCLKCFAHGRQQRKHLSSLDAAFKAIRNHTQGTMRYIIQQGVESMRLENRVFDLRVIMIYDGAQWDWVHEARLSAENSDLSNVNQGGSSIETELLLAELAGETEASATMVRLQNTAFDLATYLDSLHPDSIMEVAFDFVLGTDNQIYLVEINTKPGLASIGFSHSLDNLTAEEEHLFERWVYPHTSSLARFLQSKA